MPKMIQIRNVPDDVHRDITERAAKAGMTLSDYLKREVVRLAATPSLEEIMERVRSRRRPTLSETPAEIIRAERDSR